MRVEELLGILVDSTTRESRLRDSSETTPSGILKTAMKRVKEKQRRRKEKTDA